MRDALAEGALALIIFAAASVMLRTFRRPSPKKVQQNKAKFTSSPNGIKSASHGKAAQSDARGDNSFSRLAHSKSSCSEGALPNRPVASAAKGKPVGTREADAIANAVRSGKSAQLPHLLDAAIERLLAAAALQGVPAAYEDVAAPLLHSTLRACASARCFHDGIAAYDHMAACIGDGCD